MIELLVLSRLHVSPLCCGVCLAQLIMRAPIAVLLTSLVVTHAASWTSIGCPRSLLATYAGVAHRAGACIMHAKKTKKTKKKGATARGNRKKSVGSGYAGPAVDVSSAASAARLRKKEAEVEADAPAFVPLPRMTHVVFQSSSLEVSETDGAKSVMATQPLAPGDVLLVEHVVSGSADYALNCVLNDGPLFDALHPRTTTWSVDRLLADELEPMCIEKVDSNGFVGSDGTVAVGTAISAFNHDDRPQAIVNSFSLETEDTKLPPRLLYVLACAAVEPGEEVRIRYGDAPSALHPYIAASEPRAQASLDEVATPAAVAASSATRARKAARGWAAASVGKATDTIAARKAARGWPAASSPADRDARMDTTSGVMDMGVERVRDLVVEYAATEAFVNLCVAHDRLRRALAENDGE